MTAAPEVDDSTVTEIEKVVLTLHHRHGVCTAEDFVEAVADEDHPLHDHFEWDDTAAAHSWRKHQARLLIRRVNIELAEGRAPRFVHVTITRDGGRKDGYVPLDSAMSDEEMHSQVLREAQAGLTGWRRRLTGIKGADAARAKLDEAIGLLGDTG